MPVWPKHSSNPLHPPGTERSQKEPLTHDSSGEHWCACQPTGETAFESSHPSQYTFKQFHNKTIQYTKQCCMH